MRPGVMSFLVYFFVLLVAASSVLFGLDWMQAPLQAPPTSERTIQTVAAAAAPAHAAVASQPASTASVPSAPTASVPGAPSPAAASNVGQATDAAKAEANEPKPAPLCDVDACERAYRTFTADDCTYKPSYGPRRLCTKGNPPRRPAAVLASGEARAQVTCNVSACASAHQSFDAATCTYQTYAGTRRLCTR
jgi:hypothetical protein